MHTPAPSDFLPVLMRQLNTAYILANASLEIVACGGSTQLFASLPSSAW
jgi:hypothetical protein